MKLRYTFIAIFFLSISFSFSQQIENALLWKIEGNGLEKPSYLFGTIHITCDATLNPNILRALDNTSQLILELDMDDPNMQTEMMMGMPMKDNLTLKDLVSEEEYKLIDELFKSKVGMSVELMQTMKPGLLSAIYYPSLLECTSQSFEAELMKVAKAQEEEIKGLETVQDQLTVFDEIPYKEQAKELIKAAKSNLETEKRTIEKLMSYYQTEDLESMLELMNDDESYSSKHLDKILVNRNKKWIPKIIAFSKEMPTFFGVGAGHLVGDNGVVNLLREQGFTLTPIK